MDDSLETSEKHVLAERVVERTIFASRWLLAPFYLGLTISLVALLIRFVQKTVALVFTALPSNGADIVTSVLSLIDFSLIANLLLIVMFSGYENFVSRFELDDQKYKPAWMGRVGFGELKLKLITSIVAISAVHLLESFMNINETSDREIEWSIAIQIALVFTGLLLAIMDRVSKHDGL
jgi:uncharacterized protein (TIGR00645 family)